MGQNRKECCLGHLGQFGTLGFPAYHDNVAQRSCSLARNVMGHELGKKCPTAIWMLVAFGLRSQRRLDLVSP